MFAVDKRNNDKSIIRNAAVQKKDFDNKPYRLFLAIESQWLSAIFQSTFHATESEISLKMVSV